MPLVNLAVPQTHTSCHNKRYLLTFPSVSLIQFLLRIFAVFFFFFTFKGHLLMSSTSTAEVRGFLSIPHLPLLFLTFHRGVSHFYFSFPFVLLFVSLFMASPSLFGVEPFPACINICLSTQISISF